MEGTETDGGVVGGGEGFDVAPQDPARDGGH